MPLIRRLAAACLLVLVVPGIGNGTAEAGPFSQLVVFGDSLSDVGNVYIATGLSTGVPYPPAPPYAPGRFSNGPIWIDDLAASLGMPSPDPFLAGGTNVAVGGAESGSGYTVDGVPNLQTQVGIYLSSLGGGAVDPGALYVLWAGSNDYLHGQTNPLIPSSNVAGAVAALASLGATHFMVPNLVPLGDLPVAMNDPNPLVRPALNTLSAEHNLLLKQQLDALSAAYPITIYQPDMHSLYLDIEANPAAFGFTNITSGALSDGDVGAAGYLYWDELHPTQAGHALIAAQAFTSIPEPSTMVMSSMLLGILGMVSSYRRFKKGTVAV
ncbi:MAG: SGNH/GDSL hydrolase family protein [Planctomycetes bacterium]|nr:SGNH/GDSL hydrolase family protein [Planctomycetota bacterium]